MRHLLTSVAAFAVLIATPAWAEPVLLSDAQLDDVAAAGLKLTVTNRVSDQPGVAPVTDPLLINPWGLSQAPGGPLWVANQGSNTSTLYGATDFSKVALEVAVPGGPTGTTFVRIPGAFNITNPAGTTGNTVFAFASLNGQITGWNPTVDRLNALVAVDESAAGSAFTGLTLATSISGPRLFAADFAHGVVSMYDSSFAKVGSFTDPEMPAHFTPFNVQTLNGEVFVTFTRKPGAEVDNRREGNRLGFISVFDTNGNFLRRLKDSSKLDEPWGLVIAPPKFGKFAGALLVGNFGDGKINAFDPVTGKHLGEFGNDDKIRLDGLWALHTGPNGTITFSAGPGNETHGLIGSIDILGPRFDADEMVSLAEMRGR